MLTTETPHHSWPLWQKILFRFFFIFYCVFIGPWIFLSLIPKSEIVFNYLDDAVMNVALFFNRILFHIPAATKPPNGNGDYPEQWMLVATCGLLASAGCLLWSVFDRNKKEYLRLNFWFSLGIRYFIILNGFGYGILKMFGLQMSFPSLSQLATPLGDYLPMRFSWMFIGYSGPYQFFSGAIEVLAAVLLLFRKTATIGLLTATGVFMNVMMLNLSYDIPVKINSISLFIMCLYLLVQELPRLYKFFFLQQATPGHLFVFPFRDKRNRRTAITMKWVFVALVLYGDFNNSINRMKTVASLKMQVPMVAGIYDVVKQTKNDSTEVNSQDSLFWQNIVFDIGNQGSLKSRDQRLRQLYGRSYFSFVIDTTQKLISFKRSRADSVWLGQFKYNIRDSLMLELISYPHNDSMYVLLKKRMQPFPLAGKDFHWVSETNR